MLAIATSASHGLLPLCATARVEAELRRRRLDAHQRAGQHGAARGWRHAAQAAGSRQAAARRQGHGQHVVLLLLREPDHPAGARVGQPPQAAALAAQEAVIVGRPMRRPQRLVRQRGRRRRHPGRGRQAHHHHRGAPPPAARVPQPVQAQPLAGQLRRPAPAAAASTLHAAVRLSAAAALVERQRDERAGGDAHRQPGQAARPDGVRRQLQGTLTRRIKTKLFSPFQHRPIFSNGVEEPTS